MVFLRRQCDPGETVVLGVRISLDNEESHSVNLDKPLLFFFLNKALFPLQEIVTGWTQWFLLFLKSIPFTLKTWGKVQDKAIWRGEVTSRGRVLFMLFILLEMALSFPDNSLDNVAGIKNSECEANNISVVFITPTISRCHVHFPYYSYDSDSIRVLPLQRRN